MSDFVHLHLHTTYSLLDGQCQIVPLVKRARKLGMPALAVTDHGNLFALKSFYDECRSKKAKTYGELADVHVKPILGVEAYVTSTGDYLTRDKNERRHHLCLHAKNLTGYHNLVRLISEAHINGFYGRPRIDHRLLEKYHEGLHCSSACIAGEIAYYLDDSNRGGNNPAEAERIARWYKDVFGDDYSLEVMLHRSVKSGPDVPASARADFADLYRRQVKVTKGMLELGRKLDIRVIATNDVHFLDKNDDDSHDVLLALSTGKKMSDEKRLIYTGEEWFKDEAAMKLLFDENPELIANTREVAEMIEEYELDSKPIMPRVPIPPEYKSEDDYLDGLVWEGAHRRWGEELSAETTERVQFELDTIHRMGFPGYFLIVWDYIRAAREMGVWVGPGRGSAAGSAVAYALGITNVDPLKFDLLFERFLNPDRISMPDIDVDFDDNGRESVIDYVTQKYGADHVAHIVTFGQMAAKSAIKDVGRVMGYDLASTNKLASFVPEVPKINFKKAREASADLDAAFNSEDPTVHKLMERAGRLEGSIRQPGVHACGIIISRDPLIETLPVMPTPEKGGAKKNDGPVKADKLLTTQYDGHFVEPVGLLKMDFLGLKTLTVEKECAELLKRRGIELDPDKIPDDDRETYELFGRGETTGLFQFESPGMKKWLKALQPERLTDLVAMNALYRPGPMDYIPAFVARKQGREPIVYDHPLMEKYLKDTYGVTVYQEQVMLLSRLLAGFTRGESDMLRKAMGKKLMDIMAELKAKFVKGCLDNPEFRVDKWKDEGEAKTLIEKIWRDWEAFASYAFNKSHAVCYAWIAYQTGYMKAHYPAEFMCAQISSEIGNFDKLPGFVAEAQEILIDGEPMKLLLPDVNESGARFVPTKDAKGIRYGLGGIKGVGSMAAEMIVAEREKNGPYKGLIDFTMRLAGSNVVNKRVLENLVRTGAFSTIEPNRAKYFNNIEFALKRAQQRAKDANSAQTNFFDLMTGGSETDDDSELRPSPPWSPAEELKNERDYLGVYISGNPISACRGLINAMSVVKVDKRNAELLPFTVSMIAKKPKPAEGEEGAEGGAQAEESAAADDTVESVNSEEASEDSAAVEEETKAQTIEKLLGESDEKDWIMKSLCRNIVRAKKTANMADRAAVDKAIAKERPGLKKRIDRNLLRKLDVRFVGILNGCIEKTPKPRADGTPSPKWAIVSVDDGSGSVEGAIFARTWEGCADEMLASVDQLVLICGEIGHKAEYDKEDVNKEHPRLGELSLTIKEAYPLARAMPFFSDGLVFDIDYNDPKAEETLRRLHGLMALHPGGYGVRMRLRMPDGGVVEAELGEVGKVALSLEFLSELEKILPASAVSYTPNDRIFSPPSRTW